MVLPGELTQRKKKRLMRVISFKAQQAPSVAGPSTSSATSTATPAIQQAGACGGTSSARGRQSATATSATGEREGGRPGPSVQQPFGLSCAAAGQGRQGQLLPWPSTPARDQPGTFGPGGPANPRTTIDFAGQVSNLTREERSSLQLALDGEALRRTMPGAMAASCVFPGAFASGAQPFGQCSGLPERPAQPFGQWSGLPERPAQPSANFGNIDPDRYSPLVPVGFGEVTTGSAATSRRLDQEDGGRPGTPPDEFDVEEDALLNPPDAIMEIEVRSSDGDELSE